MSGRDANQPLRPPLPLGKSPILLRNGVLETNARGEVLGEAIRQCKDSIHVFAEVPGQCQCGTEYWEWTPDA